MLTVVDYGLGNMYSVYSALEKLSIAYRVDTDGELVSSGQTVLLPGVGAFGDGMRNLRASGQAEALSQHHKEGGQTVGLCLGAQMLLESSEEAPGMTGLGFIKGKCSRLEHGKIRVPNQDWHIVEFNPSYGLSSDQPEYFYFSHSFAMVPDLEESISATVRRGSFELAACVIESNALGIQFHPERSGPAGLNFLRYVITEGAMK